MQDACAAAHGLYTFANGEQTVASLGRIEPRRVDFGWKLAAVHVGSLRSAVSVRVAQRLKSRHASNVTIRLRVWWLLVLFPIVLFNQLLAPHPSGVALLVTLAGLYGIAYAWSAQPKAACHRGA